MGGAVIVSAMEYSFIGGSMGAVVGEAITRAIEKACDTKTPIVIVSASGGARMMEGAISLMQLAKISAALARLDDAKVPYISVLTDPTTGGVTASYAMLGDLNIAEPGALIGFAGPRVIEQTIRQKLPAWISASEFLLEHGMLDAVVHRKEMKPYIARALDFMARRELSDSAVASQLTPVFRPVSPSVFLLDVPRWPRCSQKETVRWRRCSAMSYSTAISRMFALGHELAHHALAQIRPGAHAGAAQGARAPGN